MKKTLVCMLIIGFAIGIFEYSKAANISLYENLPNDGVLTITAGDLGEYKIDTRFDLCFLVPMKANSSVVEISCKPFNNLHGNQE